MNVGTRESVALARGTILALRGKKVIPEVVVCPPFVALSEVRKVVARSHVGLGAQNMHGEEQGAFTGEISSRMLVELDVTHVILGHSERRHEFGETDEMVNKKVLRALEAGLVPIVCVGETSEEREKGEAKSVVEGQLRKAFAEARLRGKTFVLVAYEPVWAIGTGSPATVSDAVEMHEFVLGIMKDIFPSMKNGQIKVLYGGSVDGEDAYGFLREDAVDGVLVGGASIKPTQLNEILAAAIDVIEGQQAE